MMEWEDKFKSNLLEVLYRADQPRDEKGRWTSGGASAGSVEDSKVYNWALNKFGDAQTAKNFTEWFGDSKVVDANGNPMVVYHGTGAQFSAFEEGYGKGFKERGIFFTDGQSVAGAFGENIMDVYLDIRNPLEIDAGAKHWLDIELDGKGVDADDLANIARKRGHDGVILKNVKDPYPLLGNTYIVLSPTQIKSATGNVGAFDPNNPNITLSDEE